MIGKNKRHQNHFLIMDKYTNLKNKEKKED